EDGCRRTTLSSILSADGLDYSFSIATFLAQRRIPAMASEQVITYANNTLNVTAERAIPVDEFGMWRTYYFGSPMTEQQSTFHIIAFNDVIDGEFEPDVFTDKIVLVGLVNTAGLLDQYLVPSSTSGALMPGVEIQASAIQTLLRGQFPQPASLPLQSTILVALVLLASAVYALQTWYWKLLSLFAIGFISFIGASVLFSSTAIMLSLFDMLLAITLPFLLSLGIDITIERRQRERVNFLLQSVQTLAAQRLELNQAARYILQDVERIIPQSHSVLYLRQTTTTDAFLRYDSNSMTPASPSTTITDISTDVGSISPQAYVTYFEQQDRTLGAIAVYESENPKLTAQASQLLNDLMQQLTPHVDNLLLHNTIDRQRTLLDAVITDSLAGIVVVDDEGIIQQHNQIFIDLFLLSNTSVLGENLITVLHNTIQDTALVKHFSDEFQAKAPFEMNELPLHKQVVNVSAAPLATHNMWAVVMSDVTSIVELSDLKTRMLRIAAHDLKNPLTRIMGFAELLEMQLDVNEKQARYLHFIRSGGQEMVDIITDILNLERLRAGRLTVEPVDVTKLVKEVCGSQQPDVIQKRQRFNVQLPNDAVFIEADLGQLSQAVSNLVGNAIKYTPEEGQVSVVLVQEDNGIHFSVKDTGYGIPQNAQEKLFSEFFRAKSNATAHISGTGLGLSLVKSVIETHNGTIDFISEEGVGSTFWFELPYKQESETHAKA
ncbi:MAG: ATP-binding protein, partial [Chloroflexota bacterium]